MLEVRQHGGSTKSAAREAKKLQSVQQELIYRKRERLAEGLTAFGRSWRGSEALKEALG